MSCSADETVALWDLEIGRITTRDLHHRDKVRLKVVPNIGQLEFWIFAFSVFVGKKVGPCPIFFFFYQLFLKF